jgi:RHS repeat-associated protein
VKRWLSGSTYLSQTFTYFDTGNAQTATDVTGAITTYTYNGCNSSLLTGTSVTGSGLANPLTTSAAWDTSCYGGVHLTATDPNSQITTARYNENSNIFWRPSSVSDPTGATTAFTYTPYSGSTPASVESTLNFATSSTVDNFTSLDGLGRVHISQRKQSQGAANYDSVETDYDSLGRVSRVTVPYSDVKNATRSTGNATTTTYDALSRPLQITDGGGGWTKYTYNQNDVLVEVGPQVTSPQTENTKKRQLEYDALGRLTSVCELTTASGSGYGTCGQNVSQSGYWTQYTYNPLDRLTGVTQNAQVASPRQTRTYVYDWLGRMTSETNPESGTFSYSYDSDSECSGTYNGDMVKRTDARNNKTCYQYDALHRLTASLPRSGSPDYSITPQKHYVYDQSAGNGSMGRLGHAYTCPASPSDCSTWTTDLGFVYSARGQLSDVYELTPHSNGGYYHVSATYWANGLINTLNSRLGSLPTWTYNPEGEGRASTVSDSSPRTLVSPTSYNLYGLPTNITFGSTDYDAFQYDAATGRMTQFSSIVRTSSLTGTPTWNANGSLRQLAIVDGFNANNTQTCTYQHDDLARIGAVNCGTGKWNQSFTFGSDGFGNVNWTGTGLGTSFTAAYNTANHFATLGTYDSNGNLLTDGTHTYTWDADGKLATIVSGTTTTTMTYDALGRRAEQAAGTVYTEIVYGPGGSKLALVNGSNQAVISAFIPLPAGATAVYAGNTLSRYRHSDWLGSSRLSSTPTPPTSVLYDGAYSPNGESYAESGTMTDRNFTGQNQDLTTGSSGDLYDFQYREYHPIHGRWISPDPAGLAAVNPANPQSWNRYAYVNGSPLNSRDPLGLMCVAYSIGPQTCGNAGLSAYSMNHDTFWSWHPGDPPPSGEMFDSWTNAPTNGLSNQGTIYDADLGAMQGSYYAAEQAMEFWNKQAVFVYPRHAKAIAAMSGGVIGESLLTAGEPTADQVSGAPPGGPSSMTAPMTLPFAPDPIYVPGSCSTGQHWQPDPYNPAAGSCQPNGLPQQPQPMP